MRLPTFGSDAPRRHVPSRSSSSARTSNTSTTSGQAAPWIWLIGSTPKASSRRTRRWRNSSGSSRLVRGNGPGYGGSLIRHAVLPAAVRALPVAVVEGPFRAERHQPVASALDHRDVSSAPGGALAMRQSRAHRSGLYVAPGAARAAGGRSGVVPPVGLIGRRQRWDFGAGVGFRTGATGVALAAVGIEEKTDTARALQLPQGRSARGHELRPVVHQAAAFLEQAEPQYRSRARRRFSGPRPFQSAAASTRSHAARNVGTRDGRTAFVGSPPRRAT